MNETYCIHVKQLKLITANIFNYLTAKGVVRHICTIILSIYYEFIWYVLHYAVGNINYCQELSCHVAFS